MIFHNLKLINQIYFFIGPESDNNENVLEKSFLPLKPLKSKKINKKSARKFQPGWSPSPQKLKSSI